MSLVDEKVGIPEGCQPMQASAFREGTPVLLKGRPCRVVETSTSKTGKHGGAKVHFTGVDILTGKKVQEIAGSTQAMPTFELLKTEWFVHDSDEGEDRVSLINKHGQTRDDLAFPEDEQLARRLRECLAAAKEATDKEVKVTILTFLANDLISECQLVGAE